MTGSRSETTFITGGARSGKSAYAVQLADRAAGDVYYLATAEPIDEEMAARIADHKAERPDSWLTIEEPLALADALSGQTTPDSTVIVDCVTVWLGNMLNHHAQVSPDELRHAATSEIATVLEVTNRKRLHLIVISNEVGSGIVPTSPATRLYRDLLGEINQRLAALAGTAILMVSGLVVVLKSSRNANER